MTNIGYATLTVTPSIRGVKKSLERQMSTPLQQAGQDAGRGFGDAFERGMAPSLANAQVAAQRAGAALKRSSGDIARASVRVERAKTTEVEATARLAKAEGELARLRKNDAATAEDLANAESQVRARRWQLSFATKLVGDRTRDLTAAQHEAQRRTIAYANSHGELARATRAAAQSAVSAQRSAVAQTETVYRRESEMLRARVRNHETASRQITRSSRGLLRTLRAADSRTWTLTTAITAGVSAAIPALGALTAGVTAFGGALTAAVAGAGAFGLAAAPALGDVAEAMQLTEQAANGSDAAAEKLAEHLAEMTPEARKLTEQWKGLKAEFSDWSESLQPDTLPVFGRGIEFVRDRIGSLSPIVRGSSKALHGLIDDLDAALERPFWREFGARVSEAAPGAITGLGRATGNILGGTAGIFNAFMPSVPGALESIETMTARFREWGQGLGDSPGFRRFMGYVDEHAPTVKAFFASLGPAIANLAKGITPLGSATLTLATRFNELIAAAPPEALTAIAVSITAIGVALKAAAIGSALAGLATPAGWVVAALVAIAAGLTIAWQRSERFREIVSGAWDAVSDAAGRAKDFFAREVWPIVRDGWSDIAEAAGPVVDKLSGWFSDLAGFAAGWSRAWGPVWEGAAEKVSVFWDSLKRIGGNNFEIVSAGLRTLGAFLEGDWKGVWDGLSDMTSAGWDNLKTLFKTGVQLITTDLVTWFKDLPRSLGTWVSDTAPIIGEKLGEWGLAFVGWVQETTPKVLEKLHELGIAAGDWVADDLPPLLQEKFAELNTKIAQWFESLPAKIETALGNGEQVAAFLARWGPKLLLGLGAAVAAVVVGIPALFGTVTAAIAHVFITFVGRLAFRVGKKFGEMMSAAAGIVRSGGTKVVQRFREMRDFAYSYVQGLYQNARTRFNDMRASLSSGAESIRSRVIGKFRELRDNAIEAFRSAADGIGRAWGKIKAKTRKPVEVVVNTVYNNGIVPTWNAVAGLVDMPKLKKMAFRTGGILPGYTPGRDPHKFYSPTGGALELSGGEAIMRPEVTRVLGTGGVNGLNKAARTGGVSGVKRAMGFARGGVYPGGQAFARGGILGRLDSFKAQAKDLFPDISLKGAAAKVLDPLKSGLFDPIGQWGKAIAKLPRMMINPFLGWLEKTIDPKLGGDSREVIKLAKSKIGNFGGGDYSNEFTRAFGMNGQPWCAMFVSKIFKDAKAAKAINNIWSAGVWDFNRGMQKTSNPRTGDLATYRGSGHINIITDAKKRETVGGNEGDRVQKNYGMMNKATAYLRAKYATGGIYSSRDAKRLLSQDMPENDANTTPWLTQALRASYGIPTYDNGGVLRPGLQLVHNGTGRPESIRTAAQEGNIVRLIELLESGGAGSTVVNVQPPPANVGDLTRGVTKALRRSRRGGRYARV